MSGSASSAHTRTEWTALLVIILVGSILRLAWIDWGLPNRDHRWTYRVDESTFLQALAQMNPARLDFVAEKLGPRFGPGLTYMHGAVLLPMEISGLVRLERDQDYYRSHPEELRKIYLVGRLLVAFFGIASIPLLFSLVRTYGSASSALLAALLLAVLPGHVQNSRFLLADVPGGLIILLTLRLLASYLRQPTAARLFAAGAIAAFGISTKLSLIFMLLPLPLAPLLCGKGLRHSILALLFVGIMLPVAHPALLSPSEISASGAYVSNVLRPFERCDRVLEWGLLWGLGPLAVAAALLGMPLAVLRPRGTPLLATAAVIPFLAFLIVTGQDRSQLHVPSFGILALLATLPLQNAAKRLRLAVSILIGVAALHAALWSAAWVVECGHESTYDQSRREIIAIVPESSAVGFVQWYFIPQLPTERYQMVRMTIDGWQDSCAYVVIADYDMAAYQSQLAGFSRIGVWDRKPKFMGADYNPPFGHDARFTFPTITLWKRRADPASGLAGEDPAGGG